MLRRLLNLVLVACLLAGGWMPCCADAADAAAPATEAAAPDCHGGADSDPDLPDDSRSGALCDDCEHCLSRVFMGVHATLAGSAAPAAMPLLRGVDAPPSAPRAPPLRAPIATSGLA